MENRSLNYEIRSKTAMERYEFSRPVKFALRDLVIKKNWSFFDYGCGKGSDISFLKGLNIESNGYDPYFFPKNEKIKSDIVNLGYVINVIEDPEERKSTIKEAYSLADKCLIVSAQTKAAAIHDAQEFGDGCLTKRETFQKYFSQEELKALLSDVLNTTPYPAGPGIFYIFKDESARSEYLTVRYDSTRFLRTTETPFLKQKRFYPPMNEIKEEKLSKSSSVSDLVDWVSTRGRFPTEFEFTGYEEISKLGVQRNFLENWVLNNLNQDAFENAKKVRRQDILLMLALTRLDQNGRPKLKDLPLQSSLDIKAFFKTYNNAVLNADKLLFSVADPKRVQDAIQQSEVGKKLPDSIYLHTSALPYAPDILQIFVGCARAVVGDVEGDVIIKIPKKATSVSFLLYRDFDSSPHPELMLSVKVKLREARIYSRNYTKSDNPPILHRKETFVHTSYPLFNKFKKETKKEESLGLLGRTDIGFKKNWEKLTENITLS